MNAIWYLYKRTIINKTKKAIHKPISFILILVFIAYLIVIPFVFGELVKEFALNSPEGLLICLTALTFWALPANFIAYTKRKGLLYKKSDTHLDRKSVG